MRLMNDLCVGAAQFESRDRDKAFNLSRIRELSRKAVDQGAQIVSFHECSITGYTFLQTLTPPQLAEMAEPVPDGPSTRTLINIAKELKSIIMAGLIEREPDGKLYKSYVTVGPEGFITKFHKLHPFINPALSPGRGYNVIDLLGWKAGFLICYDNNLPENVRITTMMGAQVIFMPHVTGCLPSPAPGRGSVDAKLWENRHRDPARLRMEFQGPKAKGWLMRWLPARAWENGIYSVFSNAIGRDHDTIKPGLAMILDPFGEIIAESQALDDDVVVATLTEERLKLASGHRYIRARRPDLYGKLVEPPPPGQQPLTEPGWKRTFDQ
jgi:predicted amidohydrolase